MDRFAWTPRSIDRFLEDRAHRLSGIGLIGYLGWVSRPSSGSMNETPSTRAHLQKI